MRARRPALVTHSVMEARLSMGAVRVVLVEGAVRLTTHREGDALDQKRARDAIIRVVPSSGSTAADRTVTRDFLLGLGARVVWMAPASAARVVVDQSAARPSPPSASPRVIIEAMVEQARTDDRERLRGVVDAALTAERL